MLKISPADFYLNTPLYTKLFYEKKVELNDYIYKYRIPDIEGYNPINKIETTFATASNYKEIITDGTNYNVKPEILLTCKRTRAEFNFYLFWNQEERYIMKIGQYPSVADFHIADVKQYNKLLNKESLKEFTKAIGLAANGVGIGSFVYLRRIFENLIYEALLDYKREFTLEESDFNKKRMAEKIVFLKDFLPEFLVEHSELYGILSKGIHELEEEECLAYFDTVKVGIELILDEKLEKYNKEKKKADAKAKILLASKSINNKGEG
ncbi:short-chain dehydrogenase [Pedobacter sp. SG908]|uniref:short-chain dehydrogenase n=1 Tax=Pedobacter sp. SG908 TaxID=2587135 RepID=UPI001422F10B|nr:short-chain dehydrogenase [Pedobacter sp. SG908]NII81198.1 hypothetical protein [Pedobacter sp. SG908]